MFFRILALIYKELLAVWRDKKSRAMLIVPPITQLLIFSMAATLDVKNVSIGILNFDNGGQSYELIQRFVGSPTFNKIVYLDSVADIAKVIDNQIVSMVIHFDAQFSRNLKAKKAADLQLILDGRKSNTTQIIQGYAATIVQKFSEDLAVQLNIQQQQTEVFPRNWFNPNLLYYWFNIPNLTGVLTMLIGLTITALSVAREREIGTFDQLLVSPLQPIEILIGKTIPALIIGLIEGAVIVSAAIFIFRVPFIGSLPLLFFSMGVFISSVVGVGLFISSLSKNQQQAILGSFVFMTPAVTLSGYATPIENMPDWLQKVTIINPLTYYLVIAKGLFLKNMPARIVCDNLWPMALIACFTLTGAGWFFRRRLE
ncbi:MAG: ABC transporter permease [Parachlamydiaceae bacterium]